MTTRIIGVDTETYMPPVNGKATLRSILRPVCYSFFDQARGETELYLASDGSGLDRFLEYAADPDVKFVGHNVAYFDLPVIIADAQSQGREGVLDTVFGLLRDRRVIDTYLAICLKNISEGGVNTSPTGLGGAVKYLLGIDVQGKHGEDSWRKRYNELDGVPVEHWPLAARSYAELDAKYTVLLWDALNRPRRLYSADLYMQACGAFALALGAGWGLKVDGAWTEWLWDSFSADREYWAGELRTHGIMREDGTKDTKAIRATFEDAWVKVLGEVPEDRRTATGLVATNKDALRALEDEYPDAEELSPVFKAYSRFNRADKMLSTWLEPAMDAAHAGGILCPRYSPIVDTGRTSSSSPNVQNLPGHLRKEDRERRERDPECAVAAQIRGCFVPRPGKVFVACDYRALEMITLAQVLTNIHGEVTPMGQAINENKDLHGVVAAHLRGCPYEEFMEVYRSGDPEAKDQRSLSKIVNFSRPTGAMVETSIIQARSMFGMKVPRADMERAFAAWDRAYPGMRRYSSWINSNKTYEGAYRIPHSGPRGSLGQGWRERLCWEFTVAGNSPFQGLGGDVGKYTAWLLAVECYTDPDSPLYGSRVPLFVHDEFVIETDEEGHEAARDRLEEVMIKGARVFCPDIEVRVESEVLTDRWAK